MWLRNFPINYRNVSSVILLFVRYKKLRSDKIPPETLGVNGDDFSFVIITHPKILYRFS